MVVLRANSVAANRKTIRGTHDVDAEHAFYHYVQFEIPTPENLVLYDGRQQYIALYYW